MQIVEHKTERLEARVTALCGLPQCLIGRMRLTQQRFYESQSITERQLKKSVAVPYVLVSAANNRIAGCYTLYSTNIRVDDLPAELVKQLKLPRYPAFGATLIGRLARDISFRGQGIGELLLADALKVLLAMNKKLRLSPWRWMRRAMKQLTSTAVLVSWPFLKRQASYSSEWIPSSMGLKVEFIQP